MIRFFSPHTRTLRCALADERRTTRALREKCAELRAYQERIASDSRFLSQQNMDLKSENTRAFEVIAELKAELHNLRASRQRDKRERFLQ